MKTRYGAPCEGRFQMKPCSGALCTRRCPVGGDARGINPRLENLKALRAGKILLSRLSRARVAASSVEIFSSRWLVSAKLRVISDPTILNEAIKEKWRAPRRI